MEVQIFDNNDESYLKWVIKNPDSYIINTYRANLKNDKKSEYWMLHKASCKTILVTENEGGFTQRKYIKICSNSIKSLKSECHTLNKNFSGKFHECRKCFI